MNRRIPAALPAWEQMTYWIVFLLGLAYGVSNVYLASKEARHKLHYTEGSSGFMKQFSDVKDVTDNEWFAYESHLCWSLPPLLVIHIAASRALHNLCATAKWRMVAYSLMGAACLLYLLPWRFLLLVVVSSLLYFLLSCTASSLLVWALLLFCLATFTVYNRHMAELLEINSSIDFFQVLYFFGTVYLRCFYFAMERVWSLQQQKFASIRQNQISQSPIMGNLNQDYTTDESDGSASSNSFHERETTATPTSVTKRASHSSRAEVLSRDSVTDGCAANEKSCHDWPVMNKVPGLVELFFYVLYVPSLLAGPPLVFKTFIEQAENPVPLTRERLFKSLGKMLRICFWGFFNYVMLHFLYFPGLGHDGFLLRDVNKWTLATLAYLTGQFMTNKYVIIYGAMTEVAKFDGLDLPQSPACISYIYLYSDMWRSFDRGLYDCLKRYVYIPMGGSRNGFVRAELASLTTFLLLGFWHGASHTYILWAVLNFLEVNLEMLGSFLEAKPFVQQHIMARLSPGWDRRLRAVLAYPLFLLATASNQFFMAGHELGYQYSTRICLQADSFVVMGVITYSAIQVSKHLQILGHTKFS